MNRVKNFYVIIFFFSFNFSYSQVKISWNYNYRYLNYSYNSGTKIQLDDSGNVFNTGYSSGSSSRNDMVMFKFTPNGILNWSSRFADTITPYPDNSNGGGSLVFDKQGNIFNGGTKLWKYSQNGNLLWTVNPGVYRGYGRIYFDNDYNILTSSEFANSSFHLRKYSYEGDTLWVRIFKPAGTIDARWKDALLDRNGDIITTGYMNKTGIGDRYDCMTVKYSNIGELIWFDRYSEGTDNFSYSIAYDDSNNVYITGEEDLNILTIKYSPSGKIIWKRIFDGGGGDVGNDIEVDSKGNVYVTGVSIGNGIVILKYNSSGEFLWLRNQPEISFFEFHSLIKIDKFENPYLAFSIKTPLDRYEFAIAKYNMSGDFQWLSRYNYNNYYCSINDFIIDNNFSVYVTGSCGSFLTTIKLDQIITSTTTENNNFLLTYNLNQNYPNPFNPKTVISYELQITSNAELKVFDVLGNEVAELVNEKQNAGSYSVEFDGSNFASGIYFYSLITNGVITDTKRMILLK